MELKKTLTTLTNLIRINDFSSIESVLESADLESIGELLIQEEELTSEDGISISEAISMYLDILNYIEYETSIPSPVSDETYDKLVEKYKKMNNDQKIGSPSLSTDNKKTGFHKFPELRGSLDKVHFIKKEEIPEKDSRHAIEEFFIGIKRSFESIHKQVPTLLINLDLKWDGVSHIFECSHDKLERVLTRGKVDMNLGIDISHIFKVPEWNLGHMDTPLPKNVFQSSSYGIKTETFMKTTSFEEYAKKIGGKRCNRRSAVTSIVNKAEDEFEPSLLQYLSHQPFQIASTDYFELTNEDKNWVYVGKIGEHHNYMYLDSPVSFEAEISDIQGILISIESGINQIKEEADARSIPIDGVVITVANKEVVEIMGRSSDKNKFQVAYKFPSGVKKTTVKDVIFSVGTISGILTPVLIMEPVVINGNTIQNASLSNYEKMERLDLNIGDEIIVKYDIIPTVFKDETCKKGTGKKIKAPETCPVCGGKLKEGIPKCLNPNCQTKIPGKIYNYTKKLDIKNLGIETIRDFVDVGILKGIPDLYRMGSFINEISEMDGYGPKSASKIIKSPLEKRDLFPHQILGSIGIPDLSLKTMEKICRAYDIIELVNHPEDFRERLYHVNGIGEITADKFINGIEENRDTINQILTFVNLKSYSEIEEKHYKDAVTFTNIREEEFESFLEENQIEVCDKQNARVNYVITPDSGTTSTKTKWAESHNKTILTITEAKQKFGYKNKE